jgi:hypothetical protein
LTVVLIFTVIAACGSRKTPEQKLAELRLNHEIKPLNATTLYDADGNPTVVVDVHLYNKGYEKLNSLTVLIRIRGDQGAEKLAQRVTLDLSDTRPGIGVQMAATVPGVALEDTDEVILEIESPLTDEVLRTLPEFADVEK